MTRGFWLALKKLWAHSAQLGHASQSGIIYFAIVLGRVRENAVAKVWGYKPKKLI
jgi:hypothetical protein